MTIALLNLGDGVPRSRSFDVAVRLGITATFADQRQTCWRADIIRGQIGN